jgi:hypothetical protein
VEKVWISSLYVVALYSLAVQVAAHQTPLTLAANDKRAYCLYVEVVALLPHRLLHQNRRIGSLTTSCCGECCEAKDHVEQLSKDKACIVLSVVLLLWPPFVEPQPGSVFMTYL